jgi:hypothetical protein
MFRRPPTREDVKYIDKEVQVSGQGQFLEAATLLRSEQDEIVPWDSPSLMPPLCSWSSFPLEPSPGLKLLVDFFTPQSHSGRPE